MYLWKSRRRAVSPGRLSGCTVAIALPVTQEEFERDTAGTSDEHNFAREFLQGFLQDYPGCSSYSAWSVGYSHHVKVSVESARFRQGNRRHRSSLARRLPTSDIC